jgi:hypothetical protein
VNDADRRRSPDGFDDDAIFADIVAHLNDDVAEAERPAQPPAESATADAESVTADAETNEETPAESAGPRPAERPQGDPDQQPVSEPPGMPEHGDGDPQAVPAPQVWRAQEVDDEYEEHFEPPPVTPLPAGDLAFWAIIAGMCGGPLLLLYFAFFNRDASSFWTLFAIALSVGGFVLLVSRMPGHHDDDDDGARL